MIRSCIARMAFLALLLTLCGCYHLRVTPVPLEAPHFTVNKPAREVLAEVRALLQRDGYGIEEADEKNGTILTALRNFSIRAGGVTMPEGGRLYYHRLKVTVEPEAGGTTAVTVESVDLEIRSSYVYDEAGKVLSFKKRYPYDHYPGMFDLDSVNWELGRIKGYLESSLRRGAKHG